MFDCLKLLRFNASYLTVYKTAVNVDWDLEALWLFSKYSGLKMVKVGNTDNQSTLLNYSRRKVKEKEMDLVMLLRMAFNYG